MSFVRGRVIACFFKSLTVRMLPWLPQLLYHLPNVEGKQVQHVLLRVARAYPQALYYPLRTYVTEGPQTGSALCSMRTRLCSLYPHQRRKRSGLAERTLP